MTVFPGRQKFLLFCEKTLSETAVGAENKWGYKPIFLKNCKKYEEISPKVGKNIIKTPLIDL